MYWDSSGDREVVFDPVWLSLIAPTYTPMFLCLSGKILPRVTLSKTQKESQSDCFVTHWAVKMRFPLRWSSSDKLYFGSDAAFYRF